jgi:hypothetical protein
MFESESWSQEWSPLRITTEILCEILISPLRATCITHFILPNLFARRLFNSAGMRGKGKVAVEGG